MVDPNDGDSSLLSQKKPTPKGPSVDPLSRLLGNFNREGVRGGVVVKALRYKPAGRGFDSRWCH